LVLIHEHPDNMSFIIHAYGELLAMDSGYISFTQHDLVKYADNHSLILVDGEGPSASNTATSGGTNAFIVNYFDLPNTDYAEVETSYQNTDFVRNVSFINDSFFIVSDIISAEDTHTYDWLLHGNGGGDTGNSFQLTDNGSVYNVNGIQLSLFINSANEITLSGHDDYHEIGYNNTGEHTVTKASMDAEDTAISAFLIPAAESREIVYTPLEPANGTGGIIEFDNKKTLSLVKNNGDTTTVVLEEIEISTDALATVVSKSTSIIPEIIQLKTGSSFVYDNVEIIHCSEPANIALNIADGTADGFITNGCQVDLFTGNLPSSITGAASYTYESGLLSLILEDESYFSLEVEWSLVNTASDDVIIDHLFRLEQNHPNPFNPLTTISFSISGDPGSTNSNFNQADILIYNTKGQIIKEFEFNNLILGINKVIWDGSDSNGNAVSSGIYYYKLQAGDFEQTRKMIFLR